MTSEEKRSLRALAKIERFQGVVERATTDQELDGDDAEFLLGCAILFSRAYEADKKLTSYLEFSYYLILKYSVRSGDFRPLNAFALSVGYYPIARKIYEEGLIEETSISDCCIDTSLQEFETDGFIQTQEQATRREEILGSDHAELSFVAPTSYGKSSIIIDIIRQYNGQDARIAIIVPTKSLLMQTYRMIRKENFDKRVLMHDEMYQDDKSFIAVFTQERALRLMTRKNVSFDVLFIDEAHKLLNYDSRSILLSRLILKNQLRVPAQKVIYLTPFVNEVKNLRVNNKQSIQEYRIPFNIKEPEINEYGSDKKVARYNRFLNEFYYTGTESSMFRYIIRHAKKKNFFYLNSPIKIEAFAKELASNLPEVVLGNRIRSLIRELKQEVHDLFYVVDLIEHGIIYLHGKLPDLIKEYLEAKFSQIGEIKYIVANNVILEGINMPIDCLFILSARGLYGKDLTNLIGRVNRLNTIFSVKGNTLDKLLPPVHFINSAYNGKDGNMRNKIVLLRSRLFKDDIDNPVLAEFDMESLQDDPRQEKKAALYERIIANEAFLNKKTGDAVDLLKQYLIETGIAAFYGDLNDIAAVLHERITRFKNDEGFSSESMFDKIYALFIEDIDSIIDHEFKRLANEAARNYYDRHITQIQKWSMKRAITHIYEHFEFLIGEGRPRVFMGSSYGEVTRTSLENSPLKLYVDLRTKTRPQKINLAIVKLKLEEDFISFKLSKFIIMLHDYKLIDDDEYHTYIFGTTDKKRIDLTRFGLSISLLSRLEKDGQLRNLYLDDDGNLRANKAFLEYKATVNDLFRFELERFLP